MLSATANRVPDLSMLERQERIVFVPFGGGEIQSWAYRLAPLGRAECHLYDREFPLLSEQRYATARIVNLRPECRAFVTSKRSLENYLHPQAIFEASGVQMDFGDDDDVADLAARQRFLIHDPNRVWLEVTARCRRRLRNHAKHWLNRAATDRMTAKLLAARDPVGEVGVWLTTIGKMVGQLT